MLRPLAEELGLKAGDLFMLIRVAVTGQTATPPLFETMEVLGRDRCLARLRDALTSWSDRLFSTCDDVLMLLNRYVRECRGPPLLGVWGCPRRETRPSLREGGWEEER